MARLCQKKCGKRATFNLEGKPAVYCKNHAADGMVDVRSKRCLYDSCTTKPSYNFEETRKAAAYCKQHAENGMVIVFRRHCVHDPCIKAPHFNVKGRRKPAYCRLHAKDGMVDVYGKTCSQESCMTRARCNFKGFKTAVYCTQHAEDGMVDIHKKCCAYDSCTKTPIYNFEGEKAAAYCMQHTEDDMVYIWSHMCLHDSCTERPSFKYEGWKQGYCKLHAEQSKVVRSGNGSVVVVAADLGVATDSGPAAFVRVKGEISGRPVTSVSVEEVCEVAGCLKLSRPGIDWKQTTYCLNHSPVEDGFVRQTVELADIKGGCLTTSSVAPRTRPNEISGDSGGTAAKRTRHRLYRRPLPP